MMKTTKFKPKFKPKIDRFDIYNNLPHGAQVYVARKVDCHKSHVTLVLKGERKDHHGIIELTELIAALNIWNVRFSRYGRSIDWKQQAELFHKAKRKNLTKNISL